MPATIRAFIITEDKLETIAALNLSTSVHLAFFGIAVGLLAAFVITLKTVPNLPQSDQTLFTGLSIIFGFVSLFCGTNFGIGLYRSISNIGSIKKSVELVKPISQ